MKNKDTRPEQADPSASLKQALRQQGEVMARHNAGQPPEDLKVMSPEEMQRTLQELRVHQIELGIQNEELRRLHEELDSERERYFYLYDQAPVGYCTISEKGLIMETNITAANMLGVFCGALTKQPISQIINKDDRDIYNLLRKKLVETGKQQECELRMIKMDETAFWAHLAATVAPDTNGAQVFLIALTDITDRKKRETEIFYLSYHDQLTGLFNRMFYEEELKRLDTERNLPLTIVMGDVNGLKLINDSFGHAVGDELLKKVAQVITKGCRTDDIIARLGGDEFVILLPQTDADETERIIKRIQALAFKERIESIDLSISFGYEVKRGMGKRIQEVFKNAEDKMYKQKIFEGASMRGRTINVIINSLQEKDKREEQHSHRVSALCKSMGEALGLPTSEIEELKSVGLLHDIGKIGIDETILNKPGKLTVDERKEINRHPEIGYRILNTVNDMSDAANYVLYHHETWNGKGYPKGLKGVEIPFVSRIITIADAYDAMTSERSYRSALPEEVAIGNCRKMQEHNLILT